MNCCCGRRASPSRSARSPGRRSCGCARAIASLPAAANRPMSSLPRSPVNWPASFGPSPGECRRQRADRKKPRDRIAGRRQRTIRARYYWARLGARPRSGEPSTTTICRIADPTLVARPRQLRDASTVMRFRPAHQSMINRRHDGRASCLARYSPKQALERKPQIHAPATWKSGHGVSAARLASDHRPVLMIARGFALRSQRPT